MHPSARGDAFAAARHRAFIGIRLLGGAVALAAIPIYFALYGAPTPLGAVLFVWLLSPLLVAAYLSRTGDFERAHLMSTAMLAGLVALVTGTTGGLASVMAPWLAVIPLEAALSASRRTVLAAIALALAVMLGLWSAGMIGWLPSVSGASATLYLFGALSAAFYAGAVALGAAALARSGERVKLMSEARYRLLTQNMTDVITRHDRNGGVTFVSPAAERLVDVPAASLMGHGLFDRVHVADRPGFLNAFSEAARGRSVTVEYRLRQGAIPSENGLMEEPVYSWVETRCRPMAHGANGASGTGGDVVAVTRDISRHKSDAIELESARAEAERANAAKSRFLATVSHELRTPLNAIIGFSEMLRNESEMPLDPERRKEYARLIHESGQHLLAVVNGILDVSRIETGHFELRPEPLGIAPLVESCYEMMLLRADQAGLRYNLTVMPDLPELVADKLALRQVLINLISNAIKFTPRGGAVDISVRQEGGDLVFTVADTGIGIAEADQEQLGDPFFQAGSTYNRPYEGTGLGLSVVKGLVELHGGRMEIKSRLSEGTRVIVRLPRTARAPARKRETTVVERLVPRSGAERVVHTGEVEVKRRAGA